MKENRFPSLKCDSLIIFAPVAPMRRFSKIVDKTYGFFSELCAFLQLVKG